jgi:hypothetical protein
MLAAVFGLLAVIMWEIHGIHSVLEEIHLSLQNIETGLEEKDA